MSLSDECLVFAIIGMEREGSYEYLLFHCERKEINSLSFNEDIWLILFVLQKQSNREDY